VFFITKQKLVDVVTEAFGNEGHIVSLKQQIHTLKDEIADLQTTKKQELRDIEHLIKIKEEKLNIEHQKKELDMKAQYQAKEMALQTQYFEKNLTQLKEHGDNMQKIHKEILDRLPNINAQLDIKRR
jgi:vacuolar-type H+-ATPase subunit I/STV1